MESLSQEWEPSVLPVFYYNDLLASRIGDPIGLNLFEPRYQEMCRRMACDPRFFFVPNYDDYSCRVGDVGFIIRLTDMQQQRQGGSYAIRGFAEALAVVDCTWIEPDSCGLHMAHFNHLDGRVEGLSFSELNELVRAMLNRGWEHKRDPSCRAVFAHSALQDARLLLGLNWNDRAFLFVQAGADEVVRGMLQEAWTEAIPAVNRPRILPEDFAMRVLRVLPRAVTGPRMAQVHGDLLRCYTAEMREHPRPIPASQMLSMLSQIRLCSVFGMGVELNTARLELVDPRLKNMSARATAKLIEDCFPHLNHGRHGSEPIVCVRNGTNVLFYACLQSLQCQVDSADAALDMLNWRLNRLRLHVLHRARERGFGPIARLEDDVAQLVFGFVATPPKA